MCNECHSPDGFFDCGDDPEVGARINWAEGIHDAGCHDLGTSVIDGVAGSYDSVLANYREAYRLALVGG